MLSFYTPESIRKPTGFLMFSKGIEKEDCLKLVNNHWDSTVVNKKNQNFCVSVISVYL